MPRRNLSFLTLALTWWLSLAPAAWAQQDVQDSGVDGAPGPIAANAARTPQDHRLKRDYAHTPIALSITLPPTTHAQQAASAGTQEPERPGPLQIGFGRTLPGAYQGDLVRRLTWETRSDGTAVSALSVSSPEARALRIALRGTLPAGAEVRFFSLADPEQGFPPIQPQDVPAETPADAPAEEAAPLLWSPVIEGDTAGVEVSLPPHAVVSEVSLFIDRVSHLAASVLQATPRKLSDVGDAASCNIDVACRSTTPPNLARATAKMVYTEPDGMSFLCSGTLMVDSDDSSDIPYFLTANHCIDTQTVARSLNTYWGFERASCGGPAPMSVNQLAGGADLLATDAETDATLLRLRETPIGPTWYAGWSGAPLLNSFLDPTEVVGIHHPRGDLKKWSRGKPIRNSTHILQETGQSVSSILVEWSEGTIERGSSGSGLFDTTGRLRGIASGGSLSGTVCGFSRESFYGRFDLFWPQVTRWLDGPSDHGDTRAEATRLQPDTEEAGDLDRAGDVDYFRIEVAEAGRLTVETTGPTDTVGYLQDAQGRPLAEDDNAGADDNFRIVRQVPAGTYYVGVVGAPRQRVDDHGDTAEEATGVGLDSSTAGVLEQDGDVDYFRVTVTQAGTLTLETSGTTDTHGSLLSATGTTLAENDDAGTDDNFRIVHQVTAGTYYVAVRGYDANETGAYTLQTGFTTARSDDHGDTLGRATRVGLNSTTAGSIEQAGDVDYFQITVTQAGTLTVETSGTTDTYGSLWVPTDGIWVLNDDAGVGRNFRIVEQVTVGTYYVVVEGSDEDDTGPYSLRVRFTATSSDGSGLRGLLGTWQFTYRIITTFTQTYRLSRVVTTTGTPLISGTDKYGDLIIAGRIQDIRPGLNLPYEYTLLDDGIFTCRLYLFNKTGNDTVSGVQYTITNGDCSGNIFDPNPMTGRRISLSTLRDSGTLQAQTVTTDRENDELERSEAIQLLERKSAARAYSLEQGTNNSLAEIVQALSHHLENHK